MKQTSFFWQVLIGLRQELQSFINNPSKILLFYSTVIIFTFINIWECTFSSVTFFLISPYRSRPRWGPRVQGDQQNYPECERSIPSTSFLFGARNRPFTKIRSRTKIQNKKFPRNQWNEGFCLYNKNTPCLLCPIPPCKALCYSFLTNIFQVALAKVIEVYALNSFYRNHHEQKVTFFFIFFLRLL